MDDFWKALIAGLTPEKKSDLAMWWKIPLAVIFIAAILGALQ